MEDKIELTILGLSQTTVPYNTFALILREIYGNRSIPIVIGANEAQTIVLEIEKAKPPRPLTHDVIKELIEISNLLLTEILIYDYTREGTYFSKLIFEGDFEIDCRPSDAVMIALKCEVPIYATLDVLNEVGLVAHTPGNQPNVQPDSFASNKQPKTKLEQLKTQLERAIKIEDYETAARIRDEIKLILEN